MRDASSRHLYFCHIMQVIFIIAPSFGVFIRHRDSEQIHQVTLVNARKEK